MDEKIVNFLKSQHVMSLCVCDENEVYSCSAFYAFSDNFKAIVFASDENTKHMKMGLKNPKIALNIALQTRIPGRIKGIQAQGILKSICEFSADEQSEFKNLYFRAFPYALVLNPSLYVISLSWIKFTNNALAKKQIWQKNDEN